jgi:hypothetical protein
MTIYNSFISIKILKCMLHDVPLYPAGYTHVKETHTSI